MSHRLPYIELVDGARAPPQKKNCRCSLLGEIALVGKSLPMSFLIWDGFRVFSSVSCQASLHLWGMKDDFVWAGKRTLCGVLFTVIEWMTLGFPHIHQE